MADDNKPTLDLNAAADATPVAVDGRTPATLAALLDLFSAFLMIGLLGFGGIAASAHHVIVERRRWLDAKAYAELFGICSVLPGGNILNASVILGDRRAGAIGSIVALAGLMLAPLSILIGVATLYDRFADVPDVRAAVAGAASAAAGLIMGTALKLLAGVDKSWPSLAFGLATFVAVALWRYPLAAVVPIMAGLSVVVALWRMGRAP